MGSNLTPVGSFQTASTRLVVFPQILTSCECKSLCPAVHVLNMFRFVFQFLESDCDEQLMLTITFNQAVKVHSLKIRGPSDGTAPKTIKIFANQPNEVDFDSGERMEAVQKLV